MNKITLYKTVVVSTSFYREDFETEEEWNLFIKECEDYDKAEEHFFNGIEGIEAIEFASDDELQIEFD